MQYSQVSVGILSIIPSRKNGNDGEELGSYMFTCKVTINRGHMHDVGTQITK